MTEEVTPQNPTAVVVQRIQREIQSLRDTAHILTPMARTKIDSVAMGKVPVLRVASISANPDDQEVYSIPELPGKFALTKVGLLRLEALAGITKWKCESGYLESNPLKAKAVASAEIEDVDGTKREIQQSFAYDLTDGSPQAKKMKPNQLAQARANILTLVETKAMNRVRRSLLGLQSTFSAAELKKPFVIMKLVDAPLDVNDPLIRKLIIMKQLHITAEMFDAAAQDMHVMPLPAEFPVRPEPVVLPPAKTEEELRAEEKMSLLSQVVDLYPKKIRGGRPASRPSLDSLEVNELRALLVALKEKPDLA